MSLFLIIILGAIVWYFLIRPMLVVRRQFRQMQDAFNPQGRSRQQHAQRRRPGQEPPRRKKKKIDPGVGEYVEFTETTEVNRSNDGSEERTEVRSESQITDVTWEDLPS